MKWILFLLMIPLVSHGALTDADFIQLETQDEIHTNLTHQITVSEIRDEEHLKELLNYYSELISKDKKAHVEAFDAFYPNEVIDKYKLPKNEAVQSLDRLWPSYFPNLKSEPLSLGEKSLKDLYQNREPSSDFNPFQKIEKLKTKSFFQKNFRASLTLIRTVIAGGASGYVFFKTGLPLAPSILMGGLIGGMSGSIQWFIDPFVEFLDTNKHTGQARNWLLSKLPFLKSMGIQEVKNLGTRSSQLSVYLKWFLTEFAFVSIIESTLGVMGSLDWIDYYKTFWGTMGSMSVSSLATLATQGVWETSVINEFNPKVERIEKLILHAKKNNQASRLIHLQILRHRMLVNKSAMFVYGSAVQISALILKTMGLQVNWVVFGGLGVSGVVNHVRIGLKNRQSWVRKQFNKIPGVCKRYTH